MMAHDYEYADKNFDTLDSGKRQSFDTGAHRDMEEGKGRFDLLPYEPLKRWAQLLERGAQKYGERNWQKGIPLRRFLSSASRHLNQLIDGQEDEDHAAAVLFNVAGFMWTKSQMELGYLPKELAQGCNLNARTKDIVELLRGHPSE